MATNPSEHEVSQIRTGAEAFRELSRLLARQAAREFVESRRDAERCVAKPSSQEKRS